MTIGEAIDAARARLVAAGFTPDDAAVDARVLAGEAFGLDRTALVVRGADPADPAAVDRLHALLARRVTREPVAYILGRREFYGRDFRVSPAVLVPRPETELIVDAALARFPRDANIEILDVGTGSGCLAVTLSLEFPGARLSATDISAAALEVARENARRHGVLSRIAFLYAADVDAIDLLVSNPPYAALADAATIPADVLDFEPHVAVFGGADGLDVIRGVIQEAAQVLARPGCSTTSPDGGWLVMECGMGQSAEIEQMLAASGLFESIETIPDLQGIPRTVTARRDARFDERKWGRV